MYYSLEHLSFSFLKRHKFLFKKSQQTEQFAQTVGIIYKSYSMWFDSTSVSHMTLKSCYYKWIILSTIITDLTAKEKIAQKAGIPTEYIECYGKYKAKISSEYYDKIKDNNGMQISCKM